MRSSVCAIVVTYNRLNLLKECVEALKCSAMETDILIVDNASTDGTEDACKEMISANQSDRGITYCNTGANLGGAGGFNIGLRKAYEMGYEYFWIMDDDTIISADALTELFRAAQNVGEGGYGFLASNVYFTDGTPCQMNHCSISRDWNLYRTLCVEGIIKVDRATFVSLLVPRLVVEKLGLPIKEYFIWGDDTEYSYRISKKFPCYLAAKSVVVHKISDNRSTKDIANMEDRNRILRMAFSLRNDGCTYRRMGIKMFVKYTWRTTKKLMAALRADHMKLLKMRVVVKGYVKGLFFNPKIEHISS